MCLPDLERWTAAVETMVKKNAITEELIGRALDRADRGASAQEICDEFQISATTLYRWQRRYGTSLKARIARLNALEAEVKKLKATVNDLTLGARLLRVVMRRTMPAAAKRRQEMRRLRERYGVSERKACHLLGWPRSSQRYATQDQDQDGLRERILELATQGPDLGYRKIWELLRDEGRTVNHKRVYRIYREEGLHQKRGPSKKAPKDEDRGDPADSDGSDGPDETTSVDEKPERRHRASA